MSLLSPTHDPGAFPRPARPGAKGEQRRARGGRALGKVEVYTTFENAEPAWSELEALSPGSAYQTRRWLSAWSDTIGRACGADLMLVVAFARDRTPVACLPFGVIGHERIKIAGFLGGRNSNANLGLFRPGAAFTKSDLQSLFRAAAVKAKTRPDAFVLSNQPESWEGRPNPLLAFQGQRSPSFGHASTLTPDFSAFVAEKLSQEARKKLLKKRKRLAKDFGELRYVVAADRRETQMILDAFFEQKLARFRALGIESDFEHPSSRDFLDLASAGGLERGAAVELHALIAGERVVATYGGAQHRRRFHAMFNSFDMSEDAARCSPGDLLLLSVLETMCVRGVETFDLGVGEARYKEAWCEREPLFETIIPVSAKGQAFALAESARLRLKRQVKQSPWLWSLAQRLRAGL